MCAPPTGLPVLLPPPSSMRAAATTPAEPAGAYVAHFPARGSLPRKTGGSASALRVSRPARRSLALRPVWSLGRPRRPVSPKCFRLCRYLHRPLRLLPAGATVAGRDSHPLRDGAFPRHTVSYSLGMRGLESNTQSKTANRWQRVTCLSMKVRSPMPCSCSCLSPTRSQRRRRELHGADSVMAQRLETAMAHTLRLGSLAELHG